MNIAHSLEKAARFFPEKLAVIFEDRRISFQMLNTIVNRLANAFSANGIQKGDRVALYLPNIPEFIFCYMAAQKIGAITVSANPMLKSAELFYLMNDSGTALLCTTAELLEHVKPADCPSLKQVLLCDGIAGNFPTLDAWLKEGSEKKEALDMDRNDPAVILYTSGTTGMPKGAVLTHGNIISNCYSTVHHAGFTADDRAVLFLPLFHVFGQNFVMNSIFMAGATLVLFRRFVKERVLSAVREEKITLFFGVPTIYIDLLNMDLSCYDLSSIRYEFSAAASMPKAVQTKWKQTFKRPIFEGYGLTEAAPSVCYNHDIRHRHGSVGTPVENVEVKIMDAAHQEVPIGGTGEICVKGPGVMKGYWNRPEDTRKTLKNGWLFTGDIGRMDEDGYVYIVDRVKDMINVSGFKVWPAEVEQYLYQHPAVMEIAVYGVPHPQKGEAVKAAIVLRKDVHITAEEMTAFARENMAAYKVPMFIEFMEQLPKSSTGKVLKRILKEQAVS
jgi:long-chain acyl-CoA synthetase